MITEEKLEKLKKLADAMYYAAQHLTTDASRLHKAMDEYHKFIVNEYHKEESVSEDNTLRKASEEYLKVLSETPYNNTPITNAQTIVRELISFLDNPSKYNPNHIEEPVSEDLGECINDLSKQFPEVSFAKLSRIAVRTAKWQKEHIIKRLCNHANIDQMAEKFEDKYKPEKVLGTEYYKRGIFDTIKAIKEE